MSDRSVRVAWRRGEPEKALFTREWLVANGLGGYGCGTLAGACTRRFHGPLVAALPAPHARTLYVAHLDDRATLPDGRELTLSGSHPRAANARPPDLDFLDEVRLARGLPVWRYAKDGVVLERTIFLPHARNTSYVVYRLVSAPAAVRVAIAPGIFVRPHEGRLACDPPPAYDVRAIDADERDVAELAGSRAAWGAAWRIDQAPRVAGVPPLVLAVCGGESAQVIAPRPSEELVYCEEKCRGYDAYGPLFVPGTITITLRPGEEAALVATVERDAKRPSPDVRGALEAEERRRDALVSAATVCARDSLGAELVIAADQFLIEPFTRPHEVELARAEGAQARSVIAGYHWFTDWGRDTMISLEGLTLLTGRPAEARHILRTFCSHVRDGLLPNMFPEGEAEGLYHTADATMWFFHAIDRYVRATGDRDTLRHLLPTLVDILEHHLRGTRFGIRVDPADGLLTQGAEGYQLTWMDAKVDGWVVTPRRGKAVEINALYFNALKNLERWLREERGGAQADEVARHAERARASFNRRFWYEKGKYLYDVVDGEEGDDPSLRPNQIFAVSLPNPVLDRAHWEAVVSIVREKLVTPMGLRSLAPGHPDYKRKYDGDLRARDAAYHQGTVWGWLVGPFCDAWTRVYPDDRGAAKRILDGLAPHLGEACVGSISEIFDAEAPYTPRGCVAQAWSVAEALRVFAKAVAER